jgi:hypothetical protein
MNAPKWFYIIIAMPLLTSCESDDKKLERLGGDKQTACLAAEWNYQAYLKHEQDAKEWMESRRRCDLATREYNRFMR